jgi:hypothetical protein
MLLFAAPPQNQQNWFNTNKQKLTQVQDVRKRAFFAHGL